MTALPTIAELQSLLRRGEISPQEVLISLEEKIHEIDSLVGAYLSRDLQAALREAERADVTLPLGGVPIGLKDLISVADQPCTCASRILQNYRAPYNATVTEKLRANGAILFGRFNMDEFAMGSSTENSAIGPTRNPWDSSRVSGGSSGGPAAAIAADEAFGALGSDTGGSIRQPASLCGVVGLKPSYGRVSRFGLVGFASSLDQIGPLTRTVRDAALILQSIAGHDKKDSTSIDAAVPDYVRELNGEMRNVRVGVPKEYMVDALDKQVKASVENAIKQLQALGAQIVEVSLPHTEYAVSIYYIVACAEASANLARFDGVRYGYRAPDIANITDHYMSTRGAGFGREVKRRIILGTYVLSSGYYDAYYLRAEKVRQLVRRDFARAFEKADVLVSPTSPVPAFKLGEKIADPLQMYLADIFTIPANLAGICAISLPCGFANSEAGDLPIGLQLMAKPFDETRLLRVAHAYEQSTDWHKRRPQLISVTRA